MVSAATAWVIRALDELIETWGKPWRLRLDNGPELVSRALEHWAWHQAIELVFIQLGKPTQNAYIEGFNRAYRTEVLSCYVFNSLSAVQHMIEHWRHRYNLERPHAALGGIPPARFGVSQSPITFTFK